jgi:hypothetical protein
VQHIYNFGAAIVIAACSAPARQANAQPTPPETAPTTPPATSASVDSAPSDAAIPLKTQPAATKLKLGHYRNKELGIGVIIDLTEVIDNVAEIPPAKIRFDGETKVWRLQGKQSRRDRIDYVDGKHVMLEVWDDRRHAVYVPDAQTNKWSDEIEVERDADADPL